MVCVHDRLPVGRIGLVCPVASIRSRLEDRDLLRANLGSFYLRAGRARRSGLSDGLARFGVSSSPIKRVIVSNGSPGSLSPAADSIRLRSSEFRAPATRPL